MNIAQISAGLYLKKESLPLLPDWSTVITCNDTSAVMVYWRGEHWIIAKDPDRLVPIIAVFDHAWTVDFSRQIHLPIRP